MFREALGSRTSTPEFAATFLLMSTVRRYVAASLQRLKSITESTFAPNTQWTEEYATGPEILRYVPKSLLIDSANGH